MDNFKHDIDECCEVLENGGIILYPTDTIWGIGCDATNEEAIDKVFKLKNRDDKKAMIILVAEQNDIYNYANNPDKKILHYLSNMQKPTTAIYNNAKNIAKNLISNDGTIAIRIVKDEFCKKLISEFRKPIVSTSANISGEPFAENFNNISSIIKNGVDYIVQHRQEDQMFFNPSSIIKLNAEGEIEILR